MLCPGSRRFWNAPQTETRPAFRINWQEARITPPRKLTERAFFLMLAALFIWLPPIVGMFSLDGTLFGLPILFVYFFVGWAILIALCAILTRALRSAAQTERK
jgi:hypothetical protein